MKTEKIVKFNMPFDERSPDPNKNYGIGAMRIFFILKKGQKAVQIVLSTSLYLTKTIVEYQRDGRPLIKENTPEFDCWDVGYHSNTPRYNGQSVTDCDVLKKGVCYYDGSSCRGRDEKVAENFLKHGEKWIWKFLEKEWDRMFGK